jgi:hypothetical protein
VIHRSLTARSRARFCLCSWLALSLLSVGCGKEEAKRPPPPPPPTALAADVASATTTVPDPVPVVEVFSASDEFTPTGINPWNQTAFKAQSRFSLAQPQPSTALSDAEAALRDGKLPAPEPIQVDALFASFTFAPPAGDGPVLAAADVLPSPFDPQRRFVRLHIAAATSSGAAEVVAQGALAVVDWSKASVKRYRLIGFENHTQNNPNLPPVSLRSGDTITAFYEVELIADAPPALGGLTLSYLPGGGDPTLLSPAKQALPITLNATDAPEASADARFALAVALFAEVLHASPEAKAWDLNVVEALAAASAGDDTKRVAFVTLIQQARVILTPPEAPPEPTAPVPKPRASSKATTDIHPSDKEGIVKVFNQNRKDVEDCYKRIMMKHGASQGRLVLELVISESGKVEQAEVKEDSVGNGLGRCAAEKAERWKFPALRKPVRIAKPWSF